MPNLNPVQRSETFETDLNGLHNLHDISTSVYYEGETIQCGRGGMFQNNDKS